MNKDEVMEQLSPIMRTEVKNIEHSPRTRIEVTPDMVTFRPGGGARTLEVGKDGMERLTGFMGLPWNVATSLRPETLSAVSTELMARKQRYSLVVRDGTVMDVSRPHDRLNIPVERALRAIEKAIPEIEFHRVLVTGATEATLEVLGARRQPVVKGDLIQAGASISFSPIGSIEPMVQSHVLRLICTNGMTSNTILREFHYGTGGDGSSGEGDDIWQWFRASVSAAYGALNQIVIRYQQMIAEEIRPEDRALILTAMLREAKISGKDAEAIRALALENPPETSYDMMNLLTYASSHILRQAPRVRQAQLVAANYTQQETHSRVCPVCNTRR